MNTGKNYFYPVTFANLHKNNWIPVKVHKKKIIKVKCKFCNKTMTANKMNQHWCEERLI